MTIKAILAEIRALPPEERTRLLSIISHIYGNREEFVRTQAPLPA